MYGTPGFPFSDSPMKFRFFLQLKLETCACFLLQFTGPLVKTNKHSSYQWLVLSTNPSDIEQQLSSVGTYLGASREGAYTGSWSYIDSNKCDQSPPRDRKSPK